MRISVIGTGYLGAVHAACLAEIGHDVLGVDRDFRKIEALRDGRPSFYEPQLTAALVSNVKSGRLRFSDSVADAARFADVHFICVGTPQLPGELGADLSSIDAVIDEIAPNLAGNSLVVGKSTVPVGTAARLAGRLAALVPAGVDSGIAWNPEFLREGFAVEDTLRPDRLVAGVTSDAHAAVLRAVYAPLIDAGIPYIRTDLATAELIKVAANSFLATKISFINAMASMCEAAGADVGTLAEALGHDVRIGRGHLSAGLGFGGGCLGKDIRACIARGRELGVGEAMRLLQAVDEINTERRERAVDIARELAGGTLLNRNVAVLGASFKPGTDDVRESPALYVAAAMKAAGAIVRVHDPKALNNAREAHPELEYADSPVKALEDADVVLHLTEWREYRELDPLELLNVVREPRILDARNILALDRWRDGGWTVRSMGRRQPRPEPLQRPVDSVEQ